MGSQLPFHQRLDHPKVLHFLKEEDRRGGKGAGKKQGTQPVDPGKIARLAPARARKIFLVFGAIETGVEQVLHVVGGDAEHRSTIGLIPARGKKDWEKKNCQQLHILYYGTNGGRYRQHSLFQDVVQLREFLARE